METYTEKELEDKNTKELKEILKNLNLSTNGDKNELIAKILENQTYFTLLPTEIKSNIGEYQAYNNPNNQLLMEILDLIKKRIERGDKDIYVGEPIIEIQHGIYNTSYYNKIMDFLDNNDFGFIFEIDKYDQHLDLDPEYEIKKVIINKIPLITDKNMIKILKFLNKIVSIYLLNSLFYKRNLPYAFVQIYNERKESWEDRTIDKFTYNGKYID